MFYTLLNYHSLKNDYLIFRGSERLDLINRLSTNKVDKLISGNGIKTILTNDKGRIIDLITLYVFDDFIFSSCSFGNSKNVEAHLDKYIIMDDFKHEDMTGTHETILFFGDKSDKFAEQVFSFDLSKSGNNDFRILKNNGFDIMVSRNDDAFQGFKAIYPVEAKDYFENNYFIAEIRAKYELHIVNDNNFNTMRIEHGIPVFDNELNENTNPLECGLNKYVSFTKGCYIGQEVIARQDSYDKISKHLVGIKFDYKFNLDSLLNNHPLIHDNKECGNITSYTQSDRFGKIGLGFVRTQFLDINSNYSIRLNDTLYNCSINELPF